MDKSIVVFTNFWKADWLINNNQLLVDDIEKDLLINNKKVINKEEKTYKIDLNNNYKVYSIALSHPDFTGNKNLQDIPRIDCFCPTYSILKRYKANKDWKEYEKDFIGIIKSRKEDIKAWSLSLNPDLVYFLCCWENTSNGAHCHRDIIYNGFKNSKVITNIIPIYRQ
jgi:hypothetical protein